MKMTIERGGKNNSSWVIMIEDMLGKRRYNALEFNLPDRAFNYIISEFKNNIDFVIEVKGELK